MSISVTSQRWVLMGTAQASTDVWGIRRIPFPCGYSMPPGAYVGRGEALQRPADGEVWAMGGLALEVGMGGKDIPLDQAAQHVAGYRPWLSLFHHCLLDELEERQHTITVWDQGVSIFYGLWRDASQALGPCVQVDTFKQLQSQPVSLSLSTGIFEGETPVAYEHDAATVIHFMSQFMTLSVGDVYVLGPLAARRIPPGVDRLGLNALGSEFSVEIS